MAENSARLSRFNIASLSLGLAFLYLPILILVIYSFNASRLVTVWGGWSLRWYREFFHDKAMIDAAWMSLGVAAVADTAPTRRLIHAASSMARSWKNSLYQRVDQPPHTVTSREALNE